MKKPAIIFAILAAISTLLVAGDYFSIFGSKSEEKIDLIPLHFLAVDEVTGAPVSGVHVRCFQADNNNACAERGGDAPGQVSISIPVITIVTRSYLFAQNTSLRETRDPRLRVMFVHPDYANPVETFQVSELPALATRQLTITMPKSVAQKY